MLRVLSIAAAVVVTVNAAHYDAEHGFVDDVDSFFDSLSSLSLNNISDTETLGDIARQYVPKSIQHMDDTFAQFRQCGAKCLIPDDPKTISTRKETEWVRDQWDMFSYTYPPTPQIDKADPWPAFRALIEALHKDIGDIKDLAGKAGKEKKLERLRGQVMASINRYHVVAQSEEWQAYFNNPHTDKMYHRTAVQGMSELVWGQKVHFWFGPNTNRPVPTIRLTGKQNLAALVQIEFYRLQSYYMEVMSADIHTISSLTDLYELKENIHDTRKAIRILVAQGKQFPELFRDANETAAYFAEMKDFYKVVFTPVLEKLRVWEKTNTHRVSAKEEEEAKKGFLDAVEVLHSSQQKLAPEERFNTLLDKMRNSVIDVTVPEDPSWTGTYIVDPPPVRYWPLYLGVGIPVAFAGFLIGSYIYNTHFGFQDNSHQYLEDYGRKENLPNYGSSS